MVRFSVDMTTSRKFLCSHGSGRYRIAKRATNALIEINSEMNPTMDGIGG
jgi:hypothetical protein